MRNTSHHLLQEIMKLSDYFQDLSLFEHLINDSGDFIFIVRMEDAKLMYANAAAVDFLAYSIEELLNMPIHQWRQPLEGNESYLKHLEKLKDKQKLRSYGVLTSKEGAQIKVETSVRHTVIDGVDYNIAIARDITERIHLAQKEQELLEKLEQSYAELEHGICQ